MEHFPAAQWLAELLEFGEHDANQLDIFPLIGLCSVSLMLMIVLLLNNLGGQHLFFVQNNSRSRCFKKGKWYLLHE